jgi:uncharacterized surface protein with fasciclin (FAS1) repeats
MKRSLRTVLGLAVAIGVSTLAIAAGSSGDPAGSSGDHPGAGSVQLMSVAPKGDIIDVAVGPGMQRVTTLVTAVKAAGLVDALKGPGPFTVFAPTNEAFAKLPPGTVESLLKPENKDKLRAILLYHVHAGEAVTSGELKDGSFSTLNGQYLTVRHEGPTVTVNESTVTKSDVQASNGVIHWVDTVILPK